ncbi:MAG: nitroreductase [Chloroflexi bacterium]|nr:MAG: nitroreductase [Chloroflexota bacterium]
MFLEKAIKLPEINIKKDIFLHTLNQRFSCRKFSLQSLSPTHLSEILWASNGRKKGKGRIIPSAGGVYPLELFVAIGKNSVKNIPEGIYQYNWQENSIVKITEGDVRPEIAKSCFNQNFINDAPISLLISAELHRTTSWYGSRGERYVIMEAGISSQNVALICVHLRLGTVVIGAFDDKKVKAISGIRSNITPLIVMPIGYPA